MGLALVLVLALAMQATGRLDLVAPTAKTYRVPLLKRLFVGRWEECGSWTASVGHFAVHFFHESDVRLRP
ncbi:hypothetical protein O7631_06240 [Micromonospora sp. WMMD967]|uniref:hypothetical protein n=1 Tax=Micromonospora sp. WMMD967 TaxID=3016101 RepID=UPI002415ADEB|nr:hypothetical protein [Micromonospora sp. WMMD967]MDG4836110.1 hypothetical protein [Micromonospora sp. WMMD967]